jgi:hypothetical protein
VILLDRNYKKIDAIKKLAKICNLKANYNEDTDEVLIYQSKPFDPFSEIKDREQCLSFFDEYEIEKNPYDKNDLIYTVRVRKLQPHGEADNCGMFRVQSPAVHDTNAKNQAVIGAILRAYNEELIVRDVLGTGHDMTVKKKEVLEKESPRREIEL